jgi:phenylacetate-CoA ligase
MGPVLERFIAGCSGLVSKSDPELIRRYQLRRLQALVQHAYLRVPYYSRLFDQQGLKPRHIQSLADLEKIPPSSRADLQKVPVHEIVAHGYDAQKLVVHRTGGSSGEPLSIRRTWFEDRLLQAYRLRILFRLGMRATDRRAAVVTRRLSHTPVYMRSGLLRYEEIHCLWPPERILETLRKIQPDILRGFPSILAWLAGCLTSRDREQIRPRLITTDSEMMTVDMREKIREGFRAPVIDFYDSHEFNMIAWQQPSTGLYQVSEASVIAEVLRDGHPVEPGEEGEFVGTSLHSWAMPFLRFRLGDLVTRGRTGSTLARVQGRLVDRFHLPDGSSIHPYTLVNPLVNQAPWVRQYQLIQERAGGILVKLVPLPGKQPEPEAVAAIKGVLAGRLGSDVRLEMEIVDRIPAEASGKFRPYYRVQEGEINQAGIG